MPATATRIGFVREPYRLVTAGPLAEVERLYGNAARDTVEPVETYFDSQADALVMAQERLGLLSAQRSLVTTQIQDAEVGADLEVKTTLPTVRLVDEEYSRNSQAIVVSVTIDDTNDRTELDGWG